MTPFLKEVALEVLEKYEDNFANVHFVFQNKRAGVYFKQYLGKIAGRTIWAPNVYEMQSLLKKFTGLIIPDDLTLIYELYLAFNQVNKVQQADALSFYDFFGIGEIILSDFIDLDSYLVDVKQVFKNIKDLKEIDNHFSFFTEEQKKAIKLFWLNFSEEKNSKEKEKFLNLWNKLPAIYSVFTQKLLNQKLAHNGLIYREMANKIANNNLNIKTQDKFLFIGFNALNTAQEKLFEYLKKLGIAEFYWDSDKYYIEDEHQEAGLFLRKNILRFSGKNYFIPNHLDPNYKRFKDFANTEKPIYDDKKIQLIGVSLEVGQAKLLSQILNQISDNQKLNDEGIHLNQTAIVVANEDFLFPVLYSLPSEIQNFNVTMGYPFKNTQLYAFLNQYLNLHNTKSSTKNKNFYYKEVLHLIQNPITRKIDAEIAKDIENVIINENIIFVEGDFIADFPSVFLHLLFTPVATATDLLDNLMEILYYIFDVNSSINNSKTVSYENEYIYNAYTTLNHLNDVVLSTDLKNNLTIPLIAKIIKQQFEVIRIAFESNKIDGLQVMGVLETRNLDFENLIIIGMNEGIWLSNNRPPSFISENLRFAFNMPVLKQQDAIYAYLFYRLIQKAKKITILYNNITGYNSSGELSRFAQQLIYESGLPIEHLQFKQQLKPLKNSEITVNKNSDILNILDKYTIDNNTLKKSFSASALNTYLDCGLKFYFKYVAGFQESQVVEEEISSATFGTLLHDTIEKIYKDFVQKNNRQLIEKEDYEMIFTTVESFLSETFSEILSNNNPKFQIDGNRLIIKEIINKYIQNILKYDRQNSPFEIVSLEEKKGNYGIVDIGNKKISIYGIIDRIDKFSDTYRIIDYKTGSVNKEFTDIESLFNKDLEERNKAVFQIFLYGFLLNQNPQFKTKKLKLGLFDIRKISQIDFSPYLFLKSLKKEVSENDFNNLLIEYEQYMKDLLTEIYNITVPFVQTKLEKNCSYCVYVQICNK